MLTVIRDARVFAPRPLGRRDVWIAGERVAAVTAERAEPRGIAVTEVDAGGRWLLPGLVDVLTHPCGGGGEGGFANRTGEIPFAAFARAGVTSPVGALGTDSIGRSLDVLYAKVMELRSLGLAAFMYDGSYRVPPATLTGDVARDLVLIDPVVGVGEVAISDHRSSQPTVEELRRLAADVHLGATLSGKRGVVLLHVGDGADGLGIVERVLAASELPRRLLYPTHVNRRRALLDEAVGHVRDGGFADITVCTTPELVAAGDIPALDALRLALDAGAAPQRLTLSSDAGGSLPLYRDGELVGLQAAAPDALRALLGEAAGQGEALFVAALAALTSNPARALGLEGKGRIAPGADADLLLFDPGDGTIEDVFCRGRAVLAGGAPIHAIRNLEEDPHE